MDEVRDKWWEREGCPVSDDQFDFTDRESGIQKVEIREATGSLKLYVKAQSGHAKSNCKHLCEPSLSGLGRCDARLLPKERLLVTGFEQPFCKKFSAEVWRLKGGSDLKCVADNAFKETETPWIQDLTFSQVTDAVQDLIEVSGRVDDHTIRAAVFSLEG